MLHKFYSAAAYYCSHWYFARIAAVLKSATYVCRITMPQQIKNFSHLKKKNAHAHTNIHGSYCYLQHCTEEPFESTKFVATGCQKADGNTTQITFQVCRHTALVSAPNEVCNQLSRLLSSMQKENNIRNVLCVCKYKASHLQALYSLDVHILLCSENHHTLHFLKACYLNTKSERGVRGEIK